MFIAAIVLITMGGETLVMMDMRHYKSVKTHRT